MKVLVAGGKRTVGIIESLAQQTQFFVDMEFLYTEHYGEIVTELQKRQIAFDGVLFTGVAPFEYVSSHVNTLVPWEVLPHTSQAFLAALLKAGYTNHWDLTRVSVDSYSPEMVYGAYKEIGLPEEAFEIYLAKFEPSEPDYIDHLVEFHMDHYNSRRVSLCITNNFAVSDILMKHQIPTIKIDPPTEIILQRINALRLKHQLKMAEYNQIATIMVDLETYQDQLYRISELERFRSGNEAKEAIYVFAVNIRAAIFEITDGRFVLFTTLQQLEQYSDNFKTFPLFQDIRRSENIKSIFIGIGFGTDSYSAKQNAENSLIRAKRQEQDCLFLTYEDGTVAGPLTYKPTPQETHSASTANQRFLEISLRSQIGMNTLKKLHEVITQNSLEVVTPQQLAELMGMSQRNMNRLLTKLEDSGYAKVIGKETRTTLGRPGRLIRILF